MTNIYIKNGRVILKDRILDGATIAINNGKISGISRKVTPRKGSFIIDAKGSFVSPGFIDCHIHGEPEKIFFNEARYGTTAFVVAESCAPLDRIYKIAEGIKEFIRTHPFGPNVLGLRLEGPYISKERAGAQNSTYIRKPDVKELCEIIKRCSPVLKMMTIAPELKGAGPLIKLLRKHKIIASIGHSDATYESAIEGIDAGISHATHIFNAMSSMDRRDPGVVGAVLMDDRIAVEIILDLIHVHRALFELLLKLKKRDDLIVVTDSIVSERSKDTMALGGAFRFKDGRLAGSSLTMISALKNSVNISGLSLQEALSLITMNPAKLLGIEDRKGSMAQGKDADIVIFSKEFDVNMTMIRGRIAFIKGKICAG
ncbi:MAG: N-acetylglucosamine-6-phosphate deacetylase [Candidatus Omnitrophota bacterium]|nr:N-acetylglucosamine-6-phosphate deacetylase [Candidatus Omnitrophota bacterium]